MQPSPQPSLPNPMSAHLLELLRRARRSASYLHSGSASRSFPSLSSRRSSSYSIFFVRPGASHPSHRPYQRRTPSTPERTQGKGAATVPTCTAGESGLVGRRSTNTPVICKAVDDERAVGGPRRGTGCILHPPADPWGDGYVAVMPVELRGQGLNSSTDVDVSLPPEGSTPRPPCVPPGAGTLASSTDRARAATVTIVRASQSPAVVTRARQVSGHNDI